MTVVGGTHVGAEPPPPVRSTLRQALRDATLGEYEIMNELGRGGMATVFLAHDTSLDRKVAIKVLAPHLLQGEGMAERFKLEARTAAQLSHPHIIPIYAVKETADTLFFVMKHVEGRPLDDIIKKSGQLSIAMARDILIKVGSALGYAHRRDVVHRDIKPGNVMIDDEGTPIVTDFGIAKVARATGLTQTGTTIGTPSYMSPEQCQAKDVTGASDQYSLGVVAFEMLTGTLPFEGDSAVATMYKHCHDPVPPISDFRPDCPPDLVETVTRMLAKDPADRWPSMEAAVRRLESAITGGTEAVHGLAGQTGAHTPSDPQPAPSRASAGASGRGPRTGLVAAAVVAVIGVGGVVAWGPWRGAATAGTPEQTVGEVQGGADGTSGNRSTVVDNSSPQGDVALDGIDPGAEGLPSSGAPPENVLASDPVRTEEPAARGTPAPPAAVRGAHAEEAAARPGSAQARVQVREVQVRAAEPRLFVGDQTDLTAQARDQRGGVVSSVVVDTWTSSAPDVGTVDASGNFLARAPGSTVVTGVIAGVSGSTTITVAAAPVGAVTVGPEVLTLGVGETGSVTARVVGRDGTVLDDRGVRWTSADAGIADVVAATGDIRARAPGTTAVTASVDGVQGTARVVVLADARTAIAGLVDAWARALETRDVAAIRRAFPDADYEEGMLASFLPTAEGFRAQLTVDRIDENGDGATAAVTGVYRWTDRAAGRQELTVPLSFRFSRTAEGWTVVEMR
jgi:hypothetical protein